MQITTRIVNLKRIFLIPGESQPGENLYLLLLAFCYGAYFLLANVAIYSPGGVIESEEFLIYVQGWISVPILTLLAVVGVRAFKQRYFEQEDYFYPLLVGISLLASLIGIFFLSLSKHPFNPKSADLQPGHYVLILFPVIQLIALGTIYKFRRWLAYRARPEHILLLNRVFPFAVALFLINFIGIFATVPDYSISAWTVFLAVIYGAVLQFNPFLFGTPGKRGLTILIDIFVVALIILFCFDPNLNGDVHHENFYLGPVNAIVQGRTILVDVYSQYGVFVMEFLAAIFKLGHIPLTGHGMSFVDAVAVMAQFGLVYFMMRVVFKSVGYAVVGLLLGLLLNLFATVGIFQAYPSIGPFRFGLCYLLVALILLRLKYPRFRRALLGMEYALLGLASIWSIETFVYVITIFIVSRVYQTLLDWHDFRSFLRQMLVKLGAALGSILVVQGAQAVYIYLRAGQWPNWGIYFNYLERYSLGGLGTLSVDAWSPWFILVILYFTFIMGTAVYWMINHRLNGSIEIQTLLYLSFMGVAQLTYYVGRSHPNNLLHICLPAVFIALYGFLCISRLHKEDFSGFTRSTAVVFYAGLVLITMLYFPVFTSKLSETAIPTIQSWIENFATNRQDRQDLVMHFVKREMALVVSREAEDLETRETVELINKYAAQQPRVAVFISPVGTTEAIFLSKKTHIYPISDPIEDSLSVPVSELSLGHPSPLHIGDVIFLASDPTELRIASVNNDCAEIVGKPGQCIEIQLKVVNQICDQFGLDEIVATPNGASAMRLTPHGSGTSDYCSRLKAVPGTY